MKDPHSSRKMPDEKTHSKMHRSDSEESLYRASRADDRFFVLTTLLLPVIAQGAYLFDVFFYHMKPKGTARYEGLLSSILSVFVYLQYCVPLRRRYSRFFYHLFLWILAEVGTLAHIIFYAKKHDVVHVICYSIWALLDSIYFGRLIYSRVLPN